MFKKKIGITQRVMPHHKNGEIMDCLDTNWASLLISINLMPVPLPLTTTFKASEIWKALELDGLILSGGNDIQEYTTETDLAKRISGKRDDFEKALIEEALSSQKPVMGVCRGLQLINIFYGGTLERVSGHSGVRHELFSNVNNGTFTIPKEVNSFHNFAIPSSGLGQGLVPIAYDSEMHIEACFNPSDKVLGIMWHPEREAPFSKFDCKLIYGHFQI